LHFLHAPVQCSQRTVCLVRDCHISDWFQFWAANQLSAYPRDALSHQQRPEATMLSILRKARLKDKELRILML
jgi:hypothetical protein